MMLHNPRLMPLTRGGQFQKASLRNVCFDRATVVESNMRGACLAGSRCANSNLQGTILEHADLRGCRWIASSLRNCQMQHVQLGTGDLSHCDLQQANITGVFWHLSQAPAEGTVDTPSALVAHADAVGVLEDSAADSAGQQGSAVGDPGHDVPVDVFTRAASGAAAGGVTLHACKLTTVDMSGADLRHADLSHANMVNAVLLGVKWDATDLSHAVLTGAQMDSLKGCILDGVQLGAAILTRCDIEDVPEFERIHRNMRLAQLQQVKASGRVLQGFVLDRAVMQKIELRGATLRNCQLAYADLSGADLRGAVLISCNMTGVNLTDALLQDVRFER